MVDQKDLGILLLGFITLLVGIVLLSTLGDNINENVNLFTYTNDSLNFDAASTGTLTNTRIVSVSNIRNNSADLTANLSNGINVTNTGDVTVDSDFTNQSINFSGNFGGTAYVQSANARTITNLIPIFFAIGVFLIGATLVTVSFRRMGVF